MCFLSNFLKYFDDSFSADVSSNLIKWILYFNIWFSNKLFNLFDNKRESPGNHCQTDWFLKGTTSDNFFLPFFSQTRFSGQPFCSHSLL